MSPEPRPPPYGRQSPPLGQNAYIYAPQRRSATRGTDLEICCPRGWKRGVGFEPVPRFARASRFCGFEPTRECGRRRDGGGGKTGIERSLGMLKRLLCFRLQVLFKPLLVRLIGAGHKPLRLGGTGYVDRLYRLLPGEPHQLGQVCSVITGDKGGMGIKRKDPSCTRPIVPMNPNERAIGYPHCRLWWMTSIMPS